MMVAARHDALQGNTCGDRSFERLSPGRYTKGLKIRFESRRERHLRAFFGAFRGNSEDQAVMAGLKRGGVRLRAEPQIAFSYALRAGFRLVRRGGLAQDDKLYTCKRKYIKNGRAIDIPP